MTSKERAFLDKLMATGLSLMNEASENDLMDDEKFINIVASPKEGYVSVDFIKDGVRKGATRFHKFPDPDYRESIVNE